MTAFKVLLLVVLIAIFGYTLYKLILAIREYKTKKKECVNKDDSKQNENSKKEDN